MNIILSKKDLVGLNASKALKSRYIEFDDLLEFKGESELNLFISKHESASRLKCFSCHSAGNFSKADFGGKSGILSVSNALVQSACFLKLKELLFPLGLSKLAVLEATHHGPSLDSPCLFLEVGSTKKEHGDSEYCKILAQTADYIYGNYSDIIDKNAVCAIGIGGGHYSYSFSKMVDKGVCIGHICPDYHLKDLDKEMFIQMIDKTAPKPSLVLINKKINKDIFVSYCKEMGLDWMVV